MWRSFVCDKVNFVGSIKPDVNRKRNFSFIETFARDIMLIRDIFRIYLLFLTFIMLRGQSHHHHRKSGEVKGKKKGGGSRQQQKQQQQLQQQQNFHEVDAFGDDFVDFGAETGAHGQFSWHADFPLE